MDKHLMYGGHLKFKKASSEATSSDHKEELSKKASSKGSRVRDHRKIGKSKSNYDDQNYKQDKKENIFVPSDDTIDTVYEEQKEESPTKRNEMTLDDFRVTRMIDKGSFGEVFLTVNLITNKKYAMKRIK